MTEPASLSTSDSTADQTPVTPALKRVVLLVVSALVLSAALTWLASTQSTERFPGYLDTEEVIVKAPASGVLEIMDLKRGQIVLPRRELFLITDPNIEDQIAQAEANVERLEERLKIVQLDADRQAATQLTTVNREIFETKLKLAEFASQHFQGEFEETAWDDFLSDDRLSRALASNTGSTIAIESLTKPTSEKAEDRMHALVRRAAAVNRQETIEAKIQLCDEQLNRLEEQRERLEKLDSTSVNIINAQRELGQAKAELDRLQEIETEIIVEAPAYGLASKLRHANGDTVQAGEPLLALLNRRRESVRIEVPSRVVAGFGDEVKVRLVFPGREKREGRIESVPRRVTTRGTASNPESRIALRILPSGREWPAVPVGSTVYVSFDD